jgi:PAT family beta-lactamase induction signal transducer AmpG
VQTALQLSDSAGVRYATGMAMYFAQGIPKGLLHIAMPAWLASRGVAPGEIATYLAVIVLPWAFKLVTGPLMDRYEFLPMGRRRPWVMFAQLGMVLSLLGLMIVEDPVEQMGTLILLGLVVNSFTATQDVAVDGMSIDFVPAREQGRLNAFMSFGKAIGWALTSAVSGVMLVTGGLGVTAVAAAAGASVFFVALMFVREQPGERLLPWTAGQAASVHVEGKTFAAVFAGVNRVLWQRGSLIVLAIMFFHGLWNGYGDALMPIAAINLFGYTTPQWSQLVAVMGLVGAGLALAAGPLIDRFGAKRMLVLTISLVAVHAFLVAQTQHLWQDTTYVRVMLSIWVTMDPVIMVCVIALAMAICSRENSATQFAIYMSAANLGASLGAKAYGLVAEQSTYVENYTLLGVFILVMLFTVVFHRHPLNRQSEPA